MSFDTSIALAVAVTFVVLAVVVIVWWVNRTPPGYRDAHTDELPLYSVSLGRSTTPPRAAGAVPSRPDKAAARQSTAPRSAGTAAHANEPATAQASAAVARAESSDSAPGSATSAVTTAHVAVGPGAVSERPAEPGSDAAAGGASVPAETNGARAITANGVPGTEIEGQSLRFSVPLEGTLQFLPGRLEITGGVDTGREIRFVRVPGPEGTVVTFGRNEGPAYRHVQLQEATVSRNHAQMRLVDARWHLTNLSATNPVVYNGRILEHGEDQILSDGDRIEMGEVVFGFRSR